jgi:hypothetical protein
VLERISTRLSRTAALVVAGAGVLSIGAGTATAGQYHLYSCRTLAGESAPADGWSGSVAAGSAYDVYAKNTCAEGGALVAALGDQTTHATFIDTATWAFATAANETIAAATLWRAGYLHGSASEKATYQFWLAGPAQTRIFDECIYSQDCAGQGDLAHPFSSANRISVPSASIGDHLFINVSCGGGLPASECENGFGDSHGYAAALYLYAADITLEQNNGPSVSGVGGELTSAPTLKGASDVSFSATDPGAGVYEAVFSVDGRVVQATVVNENGGRCRDVGQTADGRPAFLYVQPCLRSVSVDVPFDTTRVGNGVHRLTVSVIDAAGNAAPVLNRQIAVANPLAPGAANGTNASSRATLAVNWKRTGKARLTCAYGRGQTIAGRLTGAGGTPISGAVIDLRVIPAYAGAKPLAVTSPRTGPDGRFSVKLAPGVSSRTLRFAYRSHLGDVVPVASRTLTLRVHAGIALSVSPRTASVGRSIFFRGRLRGRPIPRGGKQLVLEARSPGSRWIEFDVIRTDAHGRYRASYRFKFPGPADYRFRVRSEPESGYPFAGGSSNVVRVRER